MSKGLKIVLGIVSAIVLLAVGFTAGAVYVSMNNPAEVQEKESVASETETLVDVPSETETLVDVPSETETFEDVPSDDVALEDMDFDELLVHFEDNEYPVVWRVLWVVATNIDADGTYNDTPVHVSIQMPQEEQDFYMFDMPASFERTVEEFTDGLVDIEVTTVLYDSPITHLEDSYNCLSAASFDEDMQVSFFDYNSVICTARFSEPYNEIVSQDWLGLTSWFADVEYGFCQVASNMEYDDSPFKASELNPYEAEPWIHEWIHTLEPLCEGLGSIIPSPDGAETYGYECKNPEGINGFYDYYRDTITASVWDPAQEMYIGITPAMWRVMAYYYDQLHTPYQQ